jgi:2-keto-3-deoxy-L-rhamnonate aldolase RhmA
VARALDNLAMGIIFPRVESPELLAQAVSWTKFPPVGVRGFGLTPSHVEYENVTIPQIAEHVNDNTLVVLQIETALAVERRDELLAVPGLDAVMIGPVDLSISLGVPGDFFNPKMVAAMEKIATFGSQVALNSDAVDSRPGKSAVAVPPRSRNGMLRKPAIVFALS